jgi:hypothetical protein
MSGLILTGANVSRPSGEWRDDDYDVLVTYRPPGRVLTNRIEVEATSPLAALGAAKRALHDGVEYSDIGSSRMILLRVRIADRRLLWRACWPEYFGHSEHE